MGLLLQGGSANIADIEFEGGAGNKTVVIPKEGGTVITGTGDQTIAGLKTFSTSPIIPLKTIATGTATFTATTNNINLTGIGVGVEIGDVIQITGADDAKNNSEFTIEVITDANNIIVNQAHANKGTSKNLAARASDTGVTVKLLAKWYNAPIGLGQDWVNVEASRSASIIYTNNTNRILQFTIYVVSTTASQIVSAVSDTMYVVGTARAQSPYAASTLTGTVQRGKNYSLTNTLISSITDWFELR